MDYAALHRDHVDTLLSRTSAALEKSGFSALAIHSGTPLKRTAADDQYWPLRPTPHFQHWLPLAEPGCVLLIVPGKKPRLYRPAEQSFWEAPAQPESDHFWAQFEIAAGKPEVPAGRVAFVGDDASAAAQLGIASLNPPQLLRELDQLRARKTPYEIECLAEANRRAARHHVAYEKRAQPAQSLLLDAGACFAGYCSDITRTWVKGKSASASAFAQLVQGLESMQQRLCGRVRVGLPYEELHDESHREAAEVLRAVGISRSSSDELVARGITRAFYPHGLGHSLGLQCHDVGCALRPPRAENPYLRNTSPIAPDQVFTIEPGIYFIEALLGPLRNSPDIDWKLVDALRPLGGVRIEDDVVVEARGIRNLTREVLPEGGSYAAAGSSLAATKATGL